jgi:hypothetical protein
MDTYCCENVACNVRLAVWSDLLAQRGVIASALAEAIRADEA